MVYYGLILFLFLEYVRPNNFFPALDALHLQSVVLVGISLGAFLRKGTVKSSHILQSLNTRLIIFFLFLIVVSFFTADVRMYVLDVLKAVVGYCLVYFVIRKECDNLNKIKGVFATLVIANLAVGLLTPEILLEADVRHYLASGSFLGDSNDFALSVNIVIPLCLFLLIDAKTVLRRLFCTGTFVVLTLAVIGTQSRGGAVALACVGLYYWIKSERKFIGVIGIAFTIFLIVSFAPPQFFERMDTMRQTGDQMEGSAQGRILAWGSAVRMAADHPFVGVGAGHFAVKHGVEYRPAGFSRTELPWQTAHSIYFLALGELGLPGIGFLLAILILNFVAGERVISKMRERSKKMSRVDMHLAISLNASLIAYAVGGAFLSALYPPHLYILAALWASGRDLLLTNNELEESVALAPKDFGRNCCDGVFK